MSEGLCSFVQDCQIRLIDKQAMPLTTRDFAENAELLQVLQRFCHGRGRQAGYACSGRDGNDRIALQVLIDAQYRGGSSPKPFDLAFMLVEHGYNLPKGGRSLFRGFLHSRHKKMKPGFLVTLRTDTVQQVIIRRSLSFEIQTQVQDRLAEHSFLTEKKRDQEPTKPAVPI